MRKKATHSEEPPAPAEKKPKKKRQKVSSSFDHSRKYDVIGILMIVFALLVLLAFVSHTPRDEAVADIGFGDFLKIFSGDPEIQARADTAANWLGLFGALLAKFFINSTIGYFSIIFPLLLGVWGWFVIARRDQLRVIAYYTNYTIIGAFLLATLTGLLRQLDWLFGMSHYWSGVIGDYAAGIISRLIGTPGSIILVTALLAVVAVVVIDYDLRATFGRIGNFFSGMGAAAKERAAEKAQRRAEAAEAAAEAKAAEQVIEEEAPEPEPIEEAAAPAPKRARRPVMSRKSAPAAPRTPAEIEVRKDDWESHLRPANIPPQTPAAPRSNGNIPIDAIPGLASILEEANDADNALDANEPPKAKSPGTNGTSRNGNGTPPRKPLTPSFAFNDENESDVDETEDLPAAKPEVEVVLDEASELVNPTKLDLERDEADQRKEGEKPDFVNSHERRDVRQHVGESLQKKKEGPEDLEEVNAGLAGTRLQYRKPTVEILDAPGRTSSVSDEELRIKGELLQEKLAVFGINIKKISVTPGPVVTMFELVPDSSVKISKIVSLSDDLALALAARGIRIIAPIPGKGAVGVEIPNNEPEMVHFSSIVGSSSFRSSKAHLPLGMGKSITGEVYCTDLAKMPHMLIAGATGAGKSVGINTMISSLLYSQHPSDVKMVMIDPKKIELAQYKGLENHFLAKCPDIDEVIITDPGNAVIALKSLELEMDNRYTKLAKAGVRHVSDYNEKVKARVLKDTDTIKHYKLPFIVVIIDELADLMITAAREVEEPIARLAQLARAVGIHLIVATQRPSVDVLTGVIKANFPARIAYKVASRVDSRTILDGPGADRLLGNGDLLYQPSGYPKPIRIQNAFLSTSEVERVVEFIESQRGYQRPYLLPSVNQKAKGKAADRDMETDELLFDAARLIVRHQQGSVSLLQRRLKIGYSRAARIVDQLEMAGIVGPSDGSKAREVLVEDEIMVDQLLEV